MRGRSEGPRPPCVDTVLAGGLGGGGGHSGLGGSGPPDEGVTQIPPLLHLEMWSRSGMRGLAERLQTRL